MNNRNSKIVHRLVVAACLILTVLINTHIAMAQTAIQMGAQQNSKEETTKTKVLQRTHT